MSKIEVLFISADPLSGSGDHPRLLIDREVREIRQKVRAALHRDRLYLNTQWATRIDDLRQALSETQPQIVHFSGHGGSEGLVLETAEGGLPQHVDAAALRRFFSVFRDDIRLVVLNACHSRPQAEAIAEAVGCAIGTPSRISDEAAIAFSAAFYGSIAFGHSVQAAFDRACATLKMGGFADREEPQLVVRAGLDASRLVLITPEPGPPPHRRVAWAGAGAALSVAAVGTFLMAQRPDPCAPAREVQRAVMQAIAPAHARVGLLQASAAAESDDPTTRPPKLVEVTTLHKAGNHAADFALLREVAGTGHTDAMTSLGLAFLNGDGTPVDEGAGVEWLRKAAYERDPRAMTELAKAYLNRQGVRRDFDRHAKDWLEKAADKKYPEAMRLLGNLYRDGRGVDEADGAMALEWYAKAATAGFVDAMVDAGLMYDEGRAVPHNEKIAMCWYRAAADAGSLRGSAAIGVIDARLNKSHDVDD